jgi:hypothetical protein
MEFRVPYTWQCASRRRKSLCRSGELNEFVKMKEQEASQMFQESRITN